MHVKEMGSGNTVNYRLEHRYLNKTVKEGRETKTSSR